MVGTYFQGLQLPHEEPDLAGLVMFQKLHSPNTSLFPLIPFFIKSVQLRLPKNQHKPKKKLKIPCKNTKVQKTLEKKKQRNELSVRTDQEWDLLLPHQW